MKFLELLNESVPSIKQKTMDHFLTNNIQTVSINNNNFRKVLFTAKDLQLVVMSLRPGEDIGSEIHTNIDQFFRVEAGNGEVTFNGKTFDIVAESAFIVPQGTKHNIKNTSKTKDLKIYTIYSPPRHNITTIHKTKKDALADEEFFNGEINAK